MDKKQEKSMHKFGLLGKNIDYSFSKNYFNKKFENEEISYATYENFDIENITDFPSILEKNKDLKGLNVTIPYKELIIPYLNKLNKKAKKIGAVNTVKITKKGKLIGYNTDYYGFRKMLKTVLLKKHKKALILGTGGASKAIAYTFKKLKIKYKFVSRNSTNEKVYSYSALTEEFLQNYQIIVNCTPLGTYPKINECPDLPYDAINEHHILIDLIYNPTETKFLSNGKNNNATVVNGIKMLEFQAEKSWKIWNS